jgi:hypothetical protein
MAGTKSGPSSETVIGSWSGRRSGGVMVGLWTGRRSVLSSDGWSVGKQPEVSVEKPKRKRAA